MIPINYKVYPKSESVIRRIKLKNFKILHEDSGSSFSKVISCKNVVKRLKSVLLKVILECGATGDPPPTVLWRKELKDDLDEDFQVGEVTG